MKPYYQADTVTLFHARCEDVLPILDAGSVDLVLTDPCYGTTQLDWDVPADWSTLWPELYRVSRQKALQVVFSQQPFTTDLIVSNRRRFRYELIWPKTMPTGFLDANRRPLRAHENVLVFGQEFEGTTYNPQKVSSGPRDVRVKTHHGRKAGQYGAFRVMDQGVYTDRHPTTVLPTFSNGHGGTSDHETAKPLDLISWLILTYSNPGDLILDPFVGAGSTSEACKRLGRRCVGIEVREHPLQVAMRRLSQEVLSLEVPGYDH